ncbi:hypothetical protein C2S53_001804 [Perilla frutescens var. hirtella]|uniref:Uncharacterized protein n=1 Tax=Perilla frutescens var. hirtella TaxID=608512 RepID=A0AAD4IPC6_PERFH|nr:hypothetical protein C2S53_001804 [Perilla frutescens var. hirtella]
MAEQTGADGKHAEKTGADDKSAEIILIQNHNLFQNTQTQMVSQIPPLNINIKLTDHNYGVWSWLMRMAIGGRGCLNHITGNHPPPTDSDPDFPRWEQNDLIISSLIMMSIDSELVPNFVEYPTAKALWEGLAATYSSDGDGLQIYDLLTRAIKWDLLLENPLSSVETAYAAARREFAQAQIWRTSSNGGSEHDMDSSSLEIGGVHVARGRSGQQESTTARREGAGFRSDGRQWKDLVKRPIGRGKQGKVAAAIGNPKAIGTGKHDAGTGSMVIDITTLAKCRFGGGIDTMTYDYADIVNASTPRKQYVQTANGGMASNIRTKQLIGRGTERDGLYYVNEVAQHGPSPLTTPTPGQASLSPLTISTSGQASGPSASDSDNEEQPIMPSDPIPLSPQSDIPEVISQPETVPILSDDNNSVSEKADKGNTGRYVLPARTTRGIPPKRYSPEHLPRSSKYPIANLVKGNLPEEAKAFSIAFMHRPQKEHMEAALRIVRYLKGSPAKGIVFLSNGHLEVKGYTDADWTGNPVDRRSISGYFTLVGGNLVTWKSKKQKIVTLSSAEAEFRGIAKGIAELIWIKKLLTEIGFPPQGEYVVTLLRAKSIQQQFTLDIYVAVNSHMGPQLRQSQPSIPSHLGS